MTPEDLRHFVLVYLYAKGLLWENTEEVEKELSKAFDKNMHIYYHEGYEDGHNSCMKEWKDSGDY